MNNKQKILSVTVLLLVILILIVLSAVFRESNNQDPESINTNAFEVLQPGKSKKDDAIRELGQPITETENVLEFPSYSETRNNVVSLSDNTITKIVQNVTVPENISVDDMKTKYGEPTHILYGGESVIGFYLYIYPEKGIAYLGHSFDGTILEIWYFIPSDFATFKENYASDYSDELIEHNHGHELEK